MLRLVPLLDLPSVSEMTPRKPVSIERECPFGSANVVEQTYQCTCGSMKQVLGIAAHLLHLLAGASLLTPPPCCYQVIFLLWRMCEPGPSPVSFQSDTYFLSGSAPASLNHWNCDSCAAPRSLSGSGHHLCRW